MDKQKEKDLNMFRTLCSTKEKAEAALDFVIRYPATVQDVAHYIMVLGEIPNNNVGELLSEGYKISNLIEELISLQSPLCKRLIKKQNDFIKSIKTDQRSSKMSVAQIDNEIIKIPTSTLEFRVVKKRWFHSVIDWIYKPSSKFIVCECCYSFDLVCNKKGKIFIQRKDNPSVSKIQEADPLKNRFSQR